MSFLFDPKEAHGQGDVFLRLFIERFAPEWTGAFRYDQAKPAWTAERIDASLRAYFAAGRPNGAPRLASFEGWSDTVRSALIWLGKADPVASMELARAEDPERGDPADQERTITRAIAAGVSYFDTAVQYGNGESEKNLGRVLQKLKPANVAVGTKVRLPPSEFGRIADAVRMSLEGSLARLRLDRVDIFHLHNAITETGGGLALSVRQVLGDVVPAFERLRQQGKTRFLGITAVGDTAALHQVIDARAFDSAQVVYNMLNPSAAEELPTNYPAQDYGRLFDHTKAAGVGVVGIRVLAGGALSGSAERHPIASPAPEPIGSAMSYDADVDRARRLIALVKEGLPNCCTMF